MLERNLGKVQLVIAIAAAVYVLMPDLFAGPVDDTALAVIAVVAEMVLGIMRAALEPGSEYVNSEYVNADYVNDDFDDGFEGYD
ncbi:MAG: hypothetical protein IKG01_12910 [Lachnospiraceae bacterium]|nr:hypothetical protein [Lachnospiraceae bacterium]